jgi:hypothetical protein
VPASVVENLGVGGAFGRSSKLSKGNGGRILGIYILLVILIIVASVAVQYVMLLALVPLKSVPIVGMVLSSVSSFVVGALVGPVITIALTLLYFDQRVRKEAFDLEHMMRSLPTDASSTATAGSTI